MSSEDDLRGSTPIYTAKDVLLGLDKKVTELDLKFDGMATSIQIIVSQNLNERLVQLESRGSFHAQRAVQLAESHERTLAQLAGMATAVKALIGTSVISVIASGLAIAKVLGLF